MRTLGRCLRVWWACLVQALRRDLQFRSQTLATAVTAIVDVALSAVPVWLMLRTDASVSWVTGSAVLGLFNISAALLDTFVSPNLERFSTMVRTGELDLLLIRPVPTPWLALTRWIRPASLTRAFTGTALLVLALSHDPTPITAAQVADGMAWAGIGLAGWMLLCANLSWLAFWMTGTDPVITIAGSLRDAGQYPLGYFTSRSRRFFTTIAPALLLAGIPLAAARQQAVPHLAAALVALVLGLALTGVHWRAASRRYESASS